ncbi:MAG: hypothetical protein HOP11_14300 [Saprospiraceae bacterium]|nr:hypothetical protein [Saprospiraceae bacterium]
MNHINRTKILSLIREAVKFCPESMGSARPNTYAIIQGIDSFNKNNLGYVPDDYTNEYWSRHTQNANQMEFRPPYICPVIYGGVRSCEVGISTTIQTTDDIRIICADRYIDSKENTETAKKRSITELMVTTEATLNKIMEYLQGVKAFRVEYSAGQFAEDYFNEAYLDYCKTNSKIVNFSESTNLNKYTNSYNTFLNLNQETRIERLEYPTSNELIVGTWITINALSISCNDSLFDFFVDGTAINNEDNIYYGN